MCTNLLLSVPGSSAGSRNYASARALELSGNLATSLYLVPRSQSFPLKLKDEEEKSTRKTWQNQYGFVAIASPEAFPVFPCFVDGINEVGLSAAALWLPGTVYPQTGPHPTVAFSEFVAWMLGNYSQVATLESDLMSGAVSIIGPKTSGPTFMPLHFIATDSTGASVVVEFVNGTMNVYGPTTGANGVPPGSTSDGVLTNAPTYDWQRTNLQNYLTLDIVGPTTSTHASSGPVVGSGMLGMPGDPMSQSRFVRAWALRQGYDPSYHLLPPDGKGWLPAPGGAKTGFSDATQTLVVVAMQLVQMVMETPYGTTLAKATHKLPHRDTEDVARPLRGSIGQEVAKIEQAIADAPKAQPGDWTMWCVVRNHSQPAFYYTSAFNGIMRGITLTPDMFDPTGAPAFPHFSSIPILPSPGLSWYESVSFS